MKTEIRNHVEAFRKALELAANTRKDECREMDRWFNELENFPQGCCDLASNFLAKYLSELEWDLSPYIICLSWNENEIKKGHVIVALDGDYIDITLDQFDECKQNLKDNPVVIEQIESEGELSKFIKKIQKEESTKITTRNINIDTETKNGHDLYQWIHTTANNFVKPNSHSEKWPKLIDTEIRKAW